MLTLIKKVCYLLSVWLILAQVAENNHLLAGQPNVVFFLVDDYGWRDVGIEGSKFYETPNIDKLAKSGMRFSRGYANCQVCSPSRASIMTGLYTTQHGITDYIGAPEGDAWKRNTILLPPKYKHELGKDYLTIAEAFQGAGYKTFFAGKWHLGGEGSLPTDHGFDINQGGYAPGSPPGGFFAPFKNKYLPDQEPGESLPLRLGKETSKFIKEHKDQPFLAYLSFYSVHAPLQTTKELWQKYREKANKLPTPEHRFKVDRTLPVRQVQDHPVYAGMIESMDNAVGMVLDTLEELKLSENTIVVFTADNGSPGSVCALQTVL
jgi:arylsulfatase A-like enzyme